MKYFPLHFKRPLTRNGYKDASDDPQQIETWAAISEVTGWGIPCGKNNGIIVVDLDKKPEKEGKPAKDGFAALQ